MENKDNLSGAEGYSELTLEKLTSILEELQASEIKKKEKSYVAWGSCKSRGLIKFDMAQAWWCNDPECGLCAPFVKSFQRMVSDVIKEVKQPLPKKKKNPHFNHGRSKFHR